MIALLLLVLSGPALADGLLCTAWGEHPFRYETYAKSGGAAPAPDTPMFTERWVLGDKELHHHIRPYQDPPTTRGKLEWTWHEDRTREVRVLHDTNSSKAVRYTTEVTLKTRDARPLAEGLPTELRLTMDCERTELFGVP